MVRSGLIAVRARLTLITACARRSISSDSPSAVSANPYGSSNGPTRWKGSASTEERVSAVAGVGAERLVVLANRGARARKERTSEARFLTLALCPLPLSVLST
jgi:hypothetical protein